MAFSACTLTATTLASTNLTPFCLVSKVLRTPASAQTNFYASQLLHKHSFTPSTFTEICFYANQLLNPLLRKLAFPQTTFCTNQLLHKRAFTGTSFYANQLFDQRAFIQTTFCTNQLLQTSFYTQIGFYTNQLSHKPTFKQTTCYANHLLHQTALRNPCFGPVSRGPEGRRNAESCSIESAINKKKVPPPVADSALFTCVTCKCNVSFAKCFENSWNHLPQGMAMIVSPLPLVDIVPDLRDPDMWDQVKKTCGAYSIKDVSKCTETLPDLPPPHPKLREIMWRRRVWRQTWLRVKLVEVKKPAISLSPLRAAVA